MKKSLEETAKLTEEIFHDGFHLSTKMSLNVILLRDLSREWVRKGWVL